MDSIKQINPVKKRNKNEIKVKIPDMRIFITQFEITPRWGISPSIRKYANVFTHSGLSAACDELSRDE